MSIKTPIACNCSFLLYLFKIENSISKFDYKSINIQKNSLMPRVVNSFLLQIRNKKCLENGSLAPIECATRDSRSGT